MSPSRRSLPRLAVAALLGLPLLRPASGRGDEAGLLTSRPWGAAVAPKVLAVGEEVRTNAGQRRRVALADGSVLLVNEKTAVKRTAERKLEVAAGEVFVQAAPAGRLVVGTPKREVSAGAGRFAVRVGDDGTGVVVASGEVRVAGLDTPLKAGQQLPPRGDRPDAAPRVSHLLGWTRELMAEADGPLVPASKHAGGSLVAHDPDGQEARLALRKFHADVHVEDGFARTTIDQTYFNHTHGRLEGTFYFPLPADASLSRLAMYVDGRLNEGGMVERDYGRQVYERIIYQQKDPALLEWLDGSTFKMRVFPLEPRQEKRIVLSYSQKLPTLYGQMAYRFPAGHTLDAVGDFSVHVRVKNGAKMGWTSPSHAFKFSTDGADLVLDAAEKDARLNRDVVLALTEGPAGADAPEVRFSSAGHKASRYLMLRYRPDLPGRTERQRRDWVFLFESSGDRDPLLARTQIEIIRGLLENAGPEDTFYVVTANTRVHVGFDGARYNWQPQPVTPDNVKAAVEFLEGSHLVGALDLSQALKMEAVVFKNLKNPCLVHLGSGIAALGERRDDELVKRIPAGTQYVGVGVGKRWNRGFMKLAAERTGGYFTQINPDEPVSWRAFELAATLNTPRLLDVRVADKDGKVHFLPFTRALAQGEEVAAVARLGAKDKLPETVTVNGTLDGKPFLRELAVKDVAAKADYLMRTWAKLEIERLLAEDTAKHKDAIVALSKSMYVMTPLTSLLVLENEEMYAQYKVDRGRKDHWAMYPCPEKIDVVYEPEDGQPGDPKKGIKPSAQQVLKAILIRQAPQVLREPKRTVYEQRRAGMPGERLGRVGTPASSPDGRYLATGLRDGHFADWSVGLRLTMPVGYRFSHPGEPARVTERLEEKYEGKNLPASYHLPVLLPLPPDVNSFGTSQPASEQTSAPALVDLQKRVEDAYAAIPERYLAGLNGSIVLDPQPKAINALRKLRADREDMVVMALNDADDEGPAKNMQPDSEGAVSVLYQRPGYSGDDRLFFDLVAYAPGLNTSAADVRAVIEAEAAPDAASKVGVIDDGVRALFDKARPAGWRSLTVPPDGDVRPWAIFFDHTGRYAWERRLPNGLREQVVCDGKELLHVYPDLGLAARRTVSHFHRLAFARLVPWALPPAEDLARGADLRRIGERTVALVPHGAGHLKDGEGKPLPWVQVHFVFGDGPLVERQVVEMPSKKVLFRESYSPDGTVTQSGEDGKEIAEIKRILKAAKPVDAKPDLKGVVVLPLPYRSAEHVRRARGIEGKTPDTLSFEDGLALLAAHFAEGNGNEAADVFRRCFHNRDQRQIGFYVLLAACGQNLDSEHVDVLAEHFDEPLAKYLALFSSPVLRKHASQWAAGSNQWDEGFLQRLALAHALYQRFQNGRPIAGRPADLDRALAFVRKHKGSAFAWALMGLLADRARDDEANKKDVRAVHAELAKVWPLFADVHGLAYAACYEQARSLWKSGDTALARKQFVELYEKTLGEGSLPLIDADLRAALLDGAKADSWNALVRRTVARLVKEKHRPAVLVLARQCWQLGDQSLAQHLHTAAFRDLPRNKERQYLELAGLEFLWETGQLAEADARLRELLGNGEATQRASLWRLASKLASHRDMPARELECLEQALDAEYRHLPEAVNLQAVRADYERLLNHYLEQARALESLHLATPPDFRVKVLRVADRWRALDRDASKPCELAGRILQTIGERDLVWDYLTTPVGLRPNEAEPWADLARTLARQGELVLADRAYAAAFDAEPTNAQILWDRARNLSQAGQTNEAEKLYRRLAEGSWQPRFQGLRDQARWQLEKR
jgi:hypothetical protein